MSTFLELVNFARSESGVSGAELTTLADVSGESLRFKNWVIRAWEEIQELHPDWRWMRASYSFATTANQCSYTSAQAGISSRFGYWDRTYCTVYLTASGTADQIELDWMDYEAFRAAYLTGPQTSSRPQHFSIGDANELLLGPAPSSALYTVAGKYFKSPQTLSANADVPELPEQQRIIAYRAMLKYGYYEAASEVLARAKGDYRRILSSLEQKYLPAIRLGCPLV